jgi:hypothetical protein
MKSKIHTKKNTDTREETLVRIFDTSPLVKKFGNQLKQGTNFAHELQSALKIRVGFSKYIMNVTNLSFLYKKL